MNPTLETLFTAAARAARTTAAAVLILGASTGIARAGNWQWTVTPYAWLTDVGADVSLDGREVVDETIPVSDLLEDLVTIAQVRLEARNGAHGIYLDLFDVALQDEVTDLALPRDAGTTDLESDIGMTIVDLAGIYDPNGDRKGLSFLYGTRILDQRLEVDATIEPSGGPVSGQRYETRETLVDALIGVRMAVPFGGRFSWQMQADLSTGGTEFTWSAGPSLGVAFSRRYALTAGYRHMQVEFQDEGELEAGMTLSGALLGFRMAF
jgi:hypothetical protein